MQKTNNITIYTEEQEKEYINDFKYWSNACGELHYHGERDITEGELPEDLKRAYNKLFMENKEGLNCYLAEYKGVNGIALIAEYYRKNPESTHTNDDDNPELGLKVAEKLSKECSGTVWVAYDLGFPWVNNRATEVVLFFPADIDEETWRKEAKFFGDIAYSWEKAA